MRSKLIRKGFAKLWDLLFNKELKGKKNIVENK